MAALSVIYSNFCGMVVSETRNGVESDYVSDTLGSTIGLMGSGGTMTDRWEYWPYGEVVSRAGTNVTPLTFLGVLGYFQDVLSKLFYVRARHLRVDLARWLTVDPLWPKEYAYTYVANRPITLADPLGLGYCEDQLAKCTDAVDVIQNNCIAAVQNALSAGIAECKQLPKLLQTACILLAQATARQAYLDCYALAAPLWIACGTAYAACLARFAIVGTLGTIAAVCIFCPVCCGLVVLA